jgi:hypothetical protein
VRTWPNGMRHRSSKPATRVRLPSSAPGAASSMAERQALNLCRSGFKSLVAHHAGVKGIGIPRELKPRGLRVRLAPSAPDGHWGNLADPPGSEPGVSWFEARMASFAAAHGCGLALVRRVTRVGTGWRLHVLVAQQAEAPGRGPGGCGFKSRLAHRAPGSKDRTDLVSPLAEGGTRRGLHWPVALSAGALRLWTVRRRWFDSSPASSRLRSSSGQSVSSVRRRSSVRIGPEAPRDRSVSG